MRTKTNIRDATTDLEFRSKTELTLHVLLIPINFSATSVHGGDTESISIFISYHFLKKSHSYHSTFFWARYVVFLFATPAYLYAFLSKKKTRC